ncbi:MAG: hypothetical protein IJ374_01715 [Lachnospiraceae bacterium]|nr:hypothetical protein [Lachnospiraceae bacterium]
MEIENIREELKTKLEDAERILVGIGAEWKLGEPEREAEIAKAGEQLRNALEGKDHFVISTLTCEELKRLGFESTHTVAPLDVSLTEEQWNNYMNWLARTLNRRLVILELGEGFMQPTIIRWPFEKTAAINNKAHLYRVHKTFYQISDEIKEKATAVKGDSVALFADWN